jgi:dTDP-3-amino-3,4,6-trideoxy-alpha-D-glucose transaminase
MSALPAAGSRAGRDDRPAPVPLVRMDAADPGLLEQLLDAVREVAEEGAFTGGRHVEAFEAELAEFCETPQAVAVSSGTAALTLALRALGIGAGDEVVVPANSFIATAEAVCHVGARARFADVDPATHLVTAETVAAVMTDRVRAVVPVHLMGATADVDAIQEVAYPRGAAVVEDACQAIGARLRGRRAGTIGDAGCLSFYPAKNLGAWGDGGAVVTDDQEIAERVRLLRSHGERPRYNHLLVGDTARLHAVQAAVLRVKLRRLEQVTEERRSLGARLREALADAPVELVDLPGPGGDHVFHLFVVRSEHRDALRGHLEEHGVASAIHYPLPIHLTPAFATVMPQAGTAPVAERLASQICTLPLFPGMTDGQLARVAGAVHAFRPRRRLTAVGAARTGG